MAKYTTKTGDIHAPIEDTDVPRSLKILVLVMVGVLAGATVTVSLILNSAGLTSSLLGG